MIGRDGEFVSFNLFAYCGCNPVNKTDADGYNGFDWKTVGFVGLAILFVVLAALAIYFSGGGAAGPIMEVASAMGGSVSTGVASTATTEGASVFLDLIASGAIILFASKRGKHSNGTGGDNYSDKFAGDSKYLKDGGRIDYEYYGNRTGNIHHHWNTRKTKIWDFNNGESKFYDIPKDIQRAIETIEGSRIVEKFIEIIKQLAGN